MALPTPKNMFYNIEGNLDRQYLRVCAVYKLLKLCKIDEDRAVTLLQERRIRGAEQTVSLWVRSLEKNEWNGVQPMTILGRPYSGPRP